MLLAAHVREYVDLHVKALRDAKRQGARLARWVAEFGQGARLRDVTRDRVLAIRNRRRTPSGQEPTRSTLKNEAAVLHAALGAAVEWGRIPFNPIAGLKASGRAGAKRGSLTPEQAARLVSAAHASRNRSLTALLVVALNSGLRRGELFALRWTDITWYAEPQDGAHGEILVRAETSKSKRERRVPVNGDAARALRALPSDGEQVFTFRGKPLRDVKGGFARARERAGLGPSVTFHWLRHTFATMATASTNNLAAVQAVLGHADVRTTQGYVHPDDSQMRRAVASVSLGRPVLTSVKRRAVGGNRHHSDITASQDADE